MWALELVGRAREEVAPQRHHVGKDMRCVVHAVHEHERSGLMHDGGGRGHIADGAERVRRRADGEQPSARTEQARQEVQAEAARGDVEREPFQHDAGFLCHGCHGATLA